MSNRPDKCQYCECAHVASDHNHARRFLCGTVWSIEHQSWECCINCARRCVVPLMELRQRVAAAIEASQRMIRFGLEANSSIRCVLAADMDRVIEILEGKQ